MPRLILFVCCQSSAIDLRSNRLSLFNLVEELNVPVNQSMENVFTSFELVALWERLDGEEAAHFVQKVVVLGPSGQELGQGEGEFEIEKARHRMIGRWENLPIRELGNYSIQLWLRRRGENVWGDRPVETYELPVHRRG